ncbi:MAG: hypothetical protein ACOCYP_04095 [Planctomycetota bacterium]
MRTVSVLLVLLLTAMATATAATVRVAGLALELPPGWQADDDPPAGCIAAWRYGDPSAPDPASGARADRPAITLARSPHGALEAGFPAWVAQQRASLTMLDQSVSLHSDQAEVLAGKTGHRLGYTLRGAGLAWYQETRLLQLGQTGLALCCSAPAAQRATWSPVFARIAASITVPDRPGARSAP